MYGRRVGTHRFNGQNIVCKERVPLGKERSGGGGLPSALFPDKSDGFASNCDGTRVKRKYPSLCQHDTEHDAEKWSVKVLFCSAAGRSIFDGAARPNEKLAAFRPDEVRSVGSRMYRKTGSASENFRYRWKVGALDDNIQRVVVGDAYVASQKRFAGLVTLRAKHSGRRTRGREVYVGKWHATPDAQAERHIFMGNRFVENGGAGGSVL